MTVLWPDEKKEHYDVADLKEEDPDGFVDSLREWATSTDPFEPLSEKLMKKYDSDMSRDPDRLMGYSLRRFRTLAEDIDGLQPALYAVTGADNIGKTSFLCNLFLDLLDSNRGLSGLFVSMQDREDLIVNRFLSLRTGLPLSRVQRPQHSASDGLRLKAGYDYLAEMAQNGRLFLRGPQEIITLDDLDKEVRRRANLDFIVVIDGPHLLSPSSCLSGCTERVKSPAVLLRDLVKSFEIPIICSAPRAGRKGAEAGPMPLSSRSEAALELAERAELVLSLDPGKGGDAGVLKMQYSRNKLGASEGIRLLRFRPHTGEIEEEASEEFRVDSALNGSTGGRVQMSMV